MKVRRLNRKRVKNKSKQDKRYTFQKSRLFIDVLGGHFLEASVIDSKYIKMTGLQDFY